MTTPPTEQPAQPDAGGWDAHRGNHPQEGPRPELAHAAVVTLVFVAGTLCAFALLSWMTHREGPELRKAFVDAPTFRTWTAVAAISVVAFCDSMLAGAHALAGHPEPPDVAGGWKARLRAWVPDLKRDLRATWAASWRYGLSYVGFAVLVIIVLLTAGQGGPDVPVQGWAPLARILLGLGALAAGPWIILVWMTHDKLTRTRKGIASLPSLFDGSGSPGPVADALDVQLRALIADRRMISTAVTRLIVLVLAALLLSGALRAALITWRPSSDVLPASYVLLYGAFFAGVLGLAVIPLLRAWRETAKVFVNRVVPPSVATTTDADSARARLVSLLDLNGSLFRSPIALSSVLAPVITSLLAVFIPKVT